MDEDEAPKVRVNYSPLEQVVAQLLKNENQLAIINPNDADAFHAAVAKLNAEAKDRGAEPKPIGWIELNEVRQGWVEFLSSCPLEHAPGVLCGPVTNWWDTTASRSDGSGGASSASPAGETTPA